MLLEIILHWTIRTISSNIVVTLYFWEKKLCHDLVNLRFFAFLRSCSYLLSKLYWRGIKDECRFRNSMSLLAVDQRFDCAYKQYLNCRILHGGTLLQPWPNAFGMRKYFSQGYVIPSPKLNEHQKKRSSCFSAKIRWRPKKKRFSPEIEMVFCQN